MNVSFRITANTNDNTKILVEIPAAPITVIRKMLMLWDDRILTDELQGDCTIYARVDGNPYVIGKHNSEASWCLYWTDAEWDFILRERPLIHKDFFRHYFRVVQRSSVDETKSRYALCTHLLGNFRIVNPWIELLSDVVELLRDTGIVNDANSLITRGNQVWFAQMVLPRVEFSDLINFIQQNKQDLTFQAFNKWKRENAPAALKESDEGYDGLMRGYLQLIKSKANLPAED